MNMLPTLFFFVLASAASIVFGCPGKADYRWTEVTPSAEFPTGYNYPVFNLNGKLIAVRGESWLSVDGRKWEKGELPDSGLNSAFQKYVEFKGAVFALGTMTGNSERMSLGSRIAVTRDGRKWETLAETSNLPRRVFYGAASFLGKIWIFGGTFEGRDFDDVWNSADGVRWQKVGSNMPWGKRQNLHAIVFRERLYLIGDREVWSSADGLVWTRETERMADHPVFISGYSAVVFDDRIWLIGINRNATFQSGVLCSTDGRMWHEAAAPWSPRGAAAAWVFSGRLYITGGKYSFVDAKGATQFVYSNDVWAMSQGAMVD
jgi:hypothetical protein